MEINDLFTKVLELEKFSNQTLEEANQKVLDIRQTAEKAIQETSQIFQKELLAFEEQLEEALSKEQAVKAVHYQKEIEIQSERIKQQFAVSLPTIAEWFKKDIEQ
jgi:Na+/phosphate symporter